MADRLAWPNAVVQISERVVKITTPRGAGTGFIFSPIEGSDLVAVATAAHVIDNSHYWEEPIRISREGTEETVLLHENERAIFLDESMDTGAILFASDRLKSPDHPAALTPDDQYLRVGSEVGWLGYPAIATPTLCFFSGRISGYVEDSRTYLIDGVAINGVSGGPVFHCSADQKAVVVGVVSAYIPNRLTGEVLPGLCEVRDVVQLQKLIKRFKNVQEAKEEETVALVPPPPSERPPENK